LRSTSFKIPIPTGATEPFISHSVITLSMDGRRAWLDSVLPPLVTVVFIVGIVWLAKIDRLNILFPRKGPGGKPIA
jgi:hypothetical protein